MGLQICDLYSPISNSVFGKHFFFFLRVVVVKKAVDDLEVRSVKACKLFELVCEL